MDRDAQMTVYVYDAERGEMVDKATREPMLTAEERARPIQTPYAVGDIAGYESPIDGRWIDGRRARRYDLESNNCIEGGDIKPKGKLRNAKFAKKHGLEHLLER